MIQLVNFSRTIIIFPSIKMKPLITDTVCEE